MSFVQNFNAAAEKVKKLTKSPTDDELKEVYALYKQSTVGDVNIGKFCFNEDKIFLKL